MILYIGNKDAPTPSTIDTLGKKLKEHYDLVACSSVKNKALRLLDMARHMLVYRDRTNLLIVDTYSSLNFYYALLTATFGKLFGVPYIAILHGGDLPNRRLKKYPRLSKFIFSNSKANVTPSIYLKVEFEKEGYKTLYIPNNIDINDYPFKERSKIEPKILFVRSFAKIYNTKMAIRVLQRLLKKYPHAQLTMVGPDRDGSLEETKEYAKRLGVSDRVTFTGGLSKEEWIALAKDHDIFINTTNFDNLPVSIVEAMALGFPIVSTNVGGLPYLIDDGIDGLLVDKNDDEAMAQKIDELLNTPELVQKLSTNAREKAQNYDWGVIKREWDKILEAARG